MKHTQATKDKIRKSLKGRTLSDKHRKNISTGQAREYQAGRRKPAHLGKIMEQAPAYKGEKAGYLAIHAWVGRHFGKPKECEDCGTQDVNKRYEWANIDGQYLRVRDNWKRLCHSCHIKFDKLTGQWGTSPGNEHRKRG